MAALLLLLLLLGFSSTLASNPLVPGVGMADPHPHVYDNKTVVLYTGRDGGGPNATSWDMPDWRMFTSKNLVDWKLERVLTPGEGPLAGWTGAHFLHFISNFSSIYA